MNFKKSTLAIMMMASISAFNTYAEDGEKSSASSTKETTKIVDKSNKPIRSESTKSPTNLTAKSPTNIPSHVQKNDIGSNFYFDDYSTKSDVISLVVNEKKYKVPLFLSVIWKNKKTNIEKAIPISDHVVALITKSKGGTYEIVYAGDGMIFVGSAINKNGKDLTQEIIKKEVTPKVIDSITEKNFVAEGDSDKEIFVFVDPNCHFCELFHNKIKPYIKDKKVKVNWIPVAILRRSSLPMSANALSQGAKVLDDIYTNKEKQKYSSNPSDPKKVKTVLENNTIMKNLGLNGTPSILYKKDGKWKTMGGMPRTTEQLESLFK